MKPLTIFDYIKDVLYKKKNIFVNNHEETLDFSPFMLQRWCSMADKSCVPIINLTSNRWLLQNQSKRDTYMFLHSILPKIKQNKIAYIKKQSILDKEEDIVSMSNLFELSQREIKDAISIINIINV